MLTGTLSAASRGSAASGAWRRARARASTARITPSPQAVSIAAVPCGLTWTGEEYWFSVVPPSMIVDQVRSTEARVGTRRRKDWFAPQSRLSP